MHYQFDQKGNVVGSICLFFFFQEKYPDPLSMYLTLNVIAGIVLQQTPNSINLKWVLMAYL